MIITRKAAIGFVLLTIIIFFTTQFAYSQSPHLPKSQEISPDIYQGQPLYKGMVVSSISYEPPIVKLGDNAPVVVTAIVDVFTFICYLGLKWLEPRINNAAESLVGSVRKTP